MGKLTVSTAPANQARLWLNLSVVLVGPFMTVMDMMIVNVAIPDIRREFGATFGEAQLVVAGYGLAYAVMLITGGRVGDLFGRRRMFILGLAGFTVTSALCGLAPTTMTLILARLLQGLTAAVLFPQALALINIAFTEAGTRAKAFAALGMILGLAAGVGLVLGGILVSADFWGLAWRPIFLVNIPIGLLAILAALWLIPVDAVSTGQRLDVTGVVLSSIGLGLLLYPLVEGPDTGWPVWSLAMLGVAVPILAAFAWHQHGKSSRQDSPLLQTNLFRNPSFTIGVVLALVYYSTHSSFFLAYVFLVQDGLGRSPLAAAVILSVVPAAFMIGSIIAGRAAAEKRREVLAAGAALVVIGSGTAAGTALLGAPMQAEALIPGLLLLGFGRGLLVTPLFNTILADIPHGNIGSASGMLSTTQQVGGTFGVALVGILFTTVLIHARAAGAADAEAYGRAFAAASGYAALMGLFVLALLFCLPPSHAAGSGASRAAAQWQKRWRPASASPESAAPSPSSSSAEDQCQ
ncbi:EmrB/QacA subfamily drug resistance transporter [Bradyrhizobium algeriense]|uniref:EmrB/QacA subfamily drug resistance transporter n=1 Tax=Bradyrhizobium algeriense TaxID=634784 RepID=A0ABU8BHK6_9BRAD